MGLNNAVTLLLACCRCISKKEMGNFSVVCYFICRTGPILAVLLPERMDLGLPQVLVLPWVGSRLLWPGEVPRVSPPPSEQNQCHIFPHPKWDDTIDLDLQISTGW